MYQINATAHSWKTKTFVDLVLAETKHPSCSESPKREETQQEGGRIPREVIQPASNPLQVKTQCLREKNRVILKLGCICFKYHQMLEEERVCLTCMCPSLFGVECVNLSVTQLCPSVFTLTNHYYK